MVATDPLLSIFEQTTSSGNKCKNSIPSATPINPAASKKFPAASLKEKILRFPLVILVISNLSLL